MPFLLPALGIGALAVWWFVSRGNWKPLAQMHVTSPFGGGRNHHGVDLRAAVGTPVYAVEDGVVEFAGWDNAGGGGVVRLRHTDGTSTHYAHLQDFFVEPGNTVSAGTEIASSGNTGQSEAPHLHFALKAADRSTWLDPTDRLAV